ncbi:hypothetical protein LOK49_LG12G02593 [Camellia lanceoleosa]|uniref:Uncharacterized protein n=1 Tax=Camellia lanceoleosa TaxID=1840588 RepID=A0ACC0FSE1_9ERIC|nr:hypothetical protein LOK49_LG12G02593 [Camellia lanceoleosa]
MAFYPSKLILSLLFVIATAASVAHSIPIVDVSVAGRVVCTVPGTNCTTCCPGIAGVNVTLSCNGGRTTLAHAITNTGGSVNFTLSSADAGALFGQSQCFVYVKLPIATCYVFPPTGVLRSPVTFVRLVHGAAGPIAIFIFRIFHLVGRFS